MDLIKTDKQEEVLFSGKQFCHPDYIFNEAETRNNGDPGNFIRDVILWYMTLSGTNDT